MVVLESDFPELEKEKTKMTEKEKAKMKVQLVLEEFVQSEKKYVKTLNAIVEKLVTPALSRTDIFSADDIGTLFGNIVELRNIHSKFYAEVSDCESVGCLARAIEQQLPPMSIAYNQYCSNFPRATALFAEMQTTSPPPPPKTTSSLRRGLRGNEGEFTPNSLRSSLSFRRKESLFSPLREKRNSTAGAITRRHTVIGRSTAAINVALKGGEQSGFLKRTFSPRKSVKSCYEPDFAQTNSSRQSVFLESCLARSDLDDHLPLIAYLLEPVQRVMRYPLLLKGLKYYIQHADGAATDLIVTDRAIQIAEKLAIITNITQPYQQANKNHPTVKKTTSTSAPTSPTSTSPVKNEKKRRSFEFMRQAAERLLRSR